MALYWVWGTWNWSDATNHWATTSGGAPWAGNLPTATDDVFFDSASNATAYTVTIDATTKLCRDITFAAPASGNVTWTGSTSITVSWSMTLYSGLIRTYTWIPTFNSTSTWKTITFNWTTFVWMTFNGVWWWWTIQDNVTSNGTITVTNGSLSFNNITASFGWALSSNNTNTRTISLGSSNLTFGLITLNSTWLTFNKWTSSIINWWDITTTWTIDFYNVEQTNQVASNISWTNTFNNFTITWSTNKVNSLVLANNIVVNWTFSVNWNSSVNRTKVASNTIGTARTITAATVTASNADFQDITWAWAGSWNLSAITWNSWDCGWNSGITFTTPVTTNWQSGTTWSTATWSSRVPLPQDTATFTTAWTVTITQDMPRIGSVDFTGSANKTWTTSTDCTVFGSINLTDLATFTNNTASYTFSGRGNNILTTAWKTWTKNFVVNSPWWKLTLGSNLSITPWWSPWFQLINWEFDANDFNVTLSTSNFNSQTWTRILRMWTGTWEFQWTWTLWQLFQTWTFTVYWEWSTIKFTNTSATAISFEWNWFAYSNLWFARGASTWSITISGSNTFADFKDDGSIAHSILFTAGTTQTVTTFTVNGTAWNLITLNSTTTATHALVKSWGWTISCDYLNIQHSVATPWSTWYAGANSVNNQAVATAWSGWTFTAPPWWISTRWFLMFF